MTARKPRQRVALRPQTRSYARAPEVRPLGGHGVDAHPVATRLRRLDGLDRTPIAAAAQLGPEAVDLAVVHNKQLGLPLGQIATLLRERFGLTITCGRLVHAVRRAARQAEPTYAALFATIRGSPVVSPDETGWKVHAHLQSLWGLATPDTTVYQCHGHPRASPGADAHRPRGDRRIRNLARRGAGGCRIPSGGCESAPSPRLRQSDGATRQNRSPECAAARALCGTGASTPHPLPDAILQQLEALLTRRR